MARIERTKQTALSPVRSLRSGSHGRSVSRWHSRTQYSIKISNTSRLLTDAAGWPGTPAAPPLPRLQRSCPALRPESPDPPEGFPETGRRLTRPMRQTAPECPISPAKCEFLGIFPAHSPPSRYPAVFPDTAPNPDRRSAYWHRFAQDAAGYIRRRQPPPPLPPAPRRKCPPDRRSCSGYRPAPTGGTVPQCHRRYIPCS